ncbi:MAG: AAA family ATPase [Candidatus Omnitrophica bacterium]|nr:AAA family ATPase [Candidatus Omnitrophota bacterium]
MENSFSESKIFKNEEFLSPEFLPEFLPHREQQIKDLANNLMPASEGRNPQNTFIFGAPGIGKTAVVKFVFREFENYSGIKTTYINCWDYKTANSVLVKIILDLGFFVQRRGWAKDEIISRLIEVLNKINKSVIICLDEVDQLILNNGEEVLYDLLRINQYTKNKVGIVFVSNDPHVFVNVEPRIKSSLNIEEIEFKPYSLEEMKNILQERANLTFHSIEEGAVLLSANCAIKKGGDVRVGLECLLKAGRVAEQENSEKVKVEHVKKILPKIEKVKPNIIKEKIDNIEKIILEILKEKEKFTSGELYETYCKKIEKSVTERSFRNHVNRLIQLKLIKVKKSKGMRGQTRIISRV